MARRSPSATCGLTTILSVCLTLVPGGWGWAHPTRNAYSPTALPGAIEELEAKARESPQDFWRALALVEVYTQAERFEDAERQLVRAEALPGAEASLVRWERGEILLSQTGGEAGTAEIVAAAGACTKARYAWQIWQRVGDIWLYYVHLGDAAQAYDRAASIGLGLGMKSWSRASQVLASRARAGDEPQLWLTMAAAFSRGSANGDAEAARLLTTLESSYGDRPILHRARCIAYRKAGDTVQAIAAGRRALELDPNDLASHYLLGQLYRDQGEAGEALPHFEAMIQAAGQFRDVAGEGHIQMAEHFRQVGDLENAYVHYEQGLPNLSGAWQLHRFAALAIQARRAKQAAAFVSTHYGDLLGTWDADDPLVFAATSAALFGAGGDYDGMHRVLDEYLQSVLTAEDERRPLRRETFRELRDGPAEAASLVLTADVLAGEPGEEERAAALSSLAEAVAIAPEFGLAHLHLAWVLMDEDRARAQACAREAAALLPAGTALQAEAERAAEQR